MSRVVAWIVFIRSIKNNPPTKTKGHEIILWRDARIKSGNEFAALQNRPCFDRGAFLECADFSALFDEDKAKNRRGTSRDLLLAGGLRPLSTSASCTLTRFFAGLLEMAAHEIQKHLHDR